MIPRPALVPVRLRDLRRDEEFVTSCTREAGRVVEWGYVRDVDEHTGRVTRVRAVRCRVAGAERIFSAELVVLVPFDRPHSRQERDDARWRDPLDEPKIEHPELRATLASLAHLRARSA